MVHLCDGAKERIAGCIDLSPLRVSVVAASGRSYELPGVPFKALGHETNKPPRSETGHMTTKGAALINKRDPKGCLQKGATRLSSDRSYQIVFR